MAGKDDRGLDLRLPWGRSQSTDPEPPPPPATAQPAPEAPSARPTPRATAVDPDATVAIPETDPDRPPPDTGPLDMTDPRAAAVLARVDERLERLELGISARLDRIEEQAEARDLALEIRLEKLNGQLNGSNDASREAVSMLAGRMLAMFQEQVAGIEVALRARQEMLMAHVEAEMGERHDDLVAKVDATHRSTLEAMSGLASGPLVDRLLEGVVALGEVLDADLVNLRRLITEEHLGQARPAVELHPMVDDPDDPDPQVPGGSPPDVDDEEKPPT